MEYKIDDLTSDDLEGVIGKLQEVQKKAHIRKVTCMYLPLDWNNVFNADERAKGVHTESIPDALVLSLTTLGKVDIEYISSITGVDCKIVISTLKGSIYQNPLTWNECFYQGWETAEEYLRVKFGIEDIAFATWIKLMQIQNDFRLDLIREN